MDVQQFLTAVSALSDQALQAILDGACLVVVEDRQLRLGQRNEAFVIYELGEDDVHSPAQLRQYLMTQAEALLRDYYQFNPLSQAEFQRQMQALVHQYGEVAFAALPGELPEKTVLVEQGKLVCEAPDSPRFKYGLYLTLAESLPAPAVCHKVKSWIASGAAYADYISVNVCRFSAF